MPGSLRIPQLHMFCICQIPSLSAPPDKPLLILQIPLQCCDLSHGSLSSRGCSFWILCSSYRVIVVQLPSRIQLFATPWTAARQSSLSFTISWNLLKLMSIESVIQQQLYHYFTELQYIYIYFFFFASLSLPLHHKLLEDREFAFVFP